MAGVYIGTSGWQYRAWKDDFYKGVKAKLWLEHISSRLNAVEVNGTFYRLQKREAFESWVQRTPEDFAFAIRGHRYTSHNKKLLDPVDSIRKQVEPALGFGDKLRAVIWQTPPFFSIHLKRLDEFLKALTEEWPGPRHAFEFRHPSWMVDEVAEVLAKHRVANCISDAGTWKRWDAVTADLVYVRLHGTPHTYWSGYDAEALQQWAAKVCRWQAEGREVHVYFDNDAQGRAPHDAETLMSLVKQANPATRAKLL